MVVAGGGTAGHIEPALAVADAVRRLRPDAAITALGTEKGLETRLIPARGYELRADPAGAAAAQAQRGPARAAGAGVRGGVGGPRRAGRGRRGRRRRVRRYVALPAYLAARGRVPIVMHEANARAGLANKIGARFAARVAAAVPGSGSAAGREVRRNPVRRSRSPSWTGRRCAPQAREFFGLDPDAPTLLVFGGSQGARPINAAVPRPPRPRRGGHRGAARVRPAQRRPVPQPPAPRRTSPCRTSSGWTWPTPPPTLVLCRSGAMTVAEIVGRRPAGGVRAAAARQRRAGAQRRAGRRGGAACWSPTPS